MWVLVRQFLLSGRESLLLRQELAINLFGRDIRKCERIPIDNDAGSIKTGKIIGRDEESFIIVRQWVGMESMMLIMKKLLRVEQ